MNKALETYSIEYTGIFKMDTCYFYKYFATNGLKFETIGQTLDSCRKLRDKWLRKQSVSFTGHRHISADPKILSSKIEDKIIDTYNQGMRFFYVGGAIGFDTLAAEAVLSVKKQYTDIVLVVVVPFEGQDSLFSMSAKEQYAKILVQADDVITLSNHYFKSCYLHRNDFLISHSSLLISYWDEKSTGGTSYTVRQALKKKILVHNLY